MADARLHDSLGASGCDPSGVGGRVRPITGGIAQPPELVGCKRSLATGRYTAPSLLRFLRLFAANPRRHSWFTAPVGGAPNWPRKNAESAKRKGNTMNPSVGYLRASRIEHGLLMNFGASKFEIRNLC